MTLIKSISGIRGTIGGAPGEGLSPLDIVKFTYAYCEKMRERRPKADGERYKDVVGKDEGNSLFVILVRTRNEEAGIGEDSLLRFGET